MGILYNLCGNMEKAWMILSNSYHTTGTLEKDLNGHFNFKTSCLRSDKVSIIINGVHISTLIGKEKIAVSSYGTQNM